MEQWLINACKAKEMPSVFWRSYSITGCFHRHVAVNLNINCRSCIWKCGCFSKLNCECSPRCLLFSTNTTCLASSMWEYSSFVRLYILCCSIQSVTLNKPNGVFVKQASCYCELHERNHLWPVSRLDPPCIILCHRERNYI